MRRGRLNGTGDWHGPQVREVDGYTVSIKWKADRYGGDHMVTILRDIHVITHQRYDGPTWAGHCGGALLIPKLIERAKLIDRSAL
jgi:hypothetical protein